MGNIKLNFLKLKDDKFHFSVYRKEYAQGEQKEEGTYVFKLPEKVNDVNNYKEYLISFVEKENYKLFQCNEQTNNALSIQYIGIALKEKIQKSGVEYSFSKSKFSLKVYITLTSIPNKGNQVVEILPYFLKSEKKMGVLIDFKFNQLPNTPFNRDVQRYSLSLDSYYRSNKQFYSDKYKFIDKFLKEHLLKINAVSNICILNCNLHQMYSQQLKKKEYLFKNKQLDYSTFQGIKKYGAYINIENTGFIYCFGFEDKYKTFANDIFLGLKGKYSPGTFSGMTDIFKMPFDKNDIRRFPIADYSLKTLDKFISDIKQTQENNPTKKVIVVFIEPNTDEENEHYYYLKYHLTKFQIPIQFISNEKFVDRSALKWSLSSIGLQIFAKCGGTPWIVNPSNKDCLIIGIGSAHEQQDDGNISKYFAYSVCLDSSGIFKKVDVLSESNQAANYYTQLKRKLTLILKENANYKKVVLHLPFKIKKEEIETMKSALIDINNVEFKVIKINDENKFFGYSEHNTLIPYESEYIQISNSEYIVWFEGLKYGKENVHQKIGGPVHVEFINHEGQTNDSNLSYLQDIINLSGANWRGFNAKQLPVSIYYSQLVAKYMRGFKHFEDFDFSVFSNNLPWFL
jgi:hypothetical protein